jgi:uncharacterized protein
MYKLYNHPLEAQRDGLADFIKTNEKVWHVLTNAHQLNLPNWYIGAGCLVQTVWNIQSGFSPEFGIKDIDLIYFDPFNLSKEKEQEVEKQVRGYFSKISLEIDVKNQARVHLWYEQKFGYPIQSYTSSEAAINTWPTTATSIAMRSEPNTSLSVYAPYGLNDVYGLIARANKTQITEKIYLAKVERWKSCWPSLTVIPWQKC